MAATQATAPAAAATGVVDITVTTTNGTSAVVAADQFTYTLPATTTVLTSDAVGFVPYLQKVNLTATVTGNAPSGTG